MHTKKLHTIWQGDILAYINIILGYIQGDMGKVLNCDDSLVSKIISADRNGIRDLVPDTIYKAFFSEKIKEWNDKERDDELRVLKNFLEKDCYADTSAFEEPSMDYKQYVQAMLEFALIKRKKPPKNTEPAKIEAEPPEAAEKLPALRSRHHLFDQNSIFCGRTDELEKMYNQLRDHHLVVLSGLFGIGKSCLAKRYAALHKDEYAYIQEVRYEGSFSQLLLSLDFENLNEPGTEEEARLSYRKNLLLQITDPTLLIFDNIDDPPNDINILTELRKNPALDIIITARLVDCFDEASTIRVEAPDEETQFALFEMYYNKVPGSMRDGVFRLLEFVAGNPLLIELIAKTMDAIELDCDEMLQGLRSGAKNTHFPKVPDGSQHADLWQYIWNIFDINPLSEDQADILRQLTLAPATGVSRRLFLKELSAGNGTALNELESKSWVIRDVRENGRNEVEKIVKLHPMIREVAKYKLEPSCEKCRVFLERLCELMRLETPSEYNEDLCKLGLSAADTINFSEEPEPRNLEYLLTFTGFLSEQESWKYRYRELLKLSLCALELWKRGEKERFQPETPIELHMRLGWFYQQLPDYKQSIRHLQKAAELSAENSMPRARAYLRLGEVYRKDSKYSEALKYDNLALDIFKEAYDIAEVKNAMGVVYLNMGDKEAKTEPQKATECYEAANNYYREALQLWEKCRGPQQPETLEKKLAYANHNIGTAMYHLGEYKEAVKYHTIGLKLRQNGKFQEWERDSTASYVWLGKDYTALGDKNKSKEMIEKAREEREKLLGREHPDYAWSLDSLSDWHAQFGDIREAVSLMEEVIKIRRRVLGETHEYTQRAIKKCAELKTRV